MLDIKIMGKTSLEIVALLSFTAVATTSAAGPITGVSTSVSEATAVAPPVPEAENDSATEAASRERDENGTGATAGFDAATLFDFSGLPLLRLGGPMFITLEARDKLRAQQGPLMQQDVVVGLVSGAPADIGNVSFTPETGPVIVPTPGGGGGGGGAAAIPEPATLLLVAPALAAGLWRRRRSR